MTDLVPYHDARPVWVDLMKPAADLASQIAGTDFVPESYRRNPAAIAACIMFGAEIGVPPMQSLSKIDVIKGRPAPRAELARALALAAGHEVWVEETTNTRVTVSGKRRGSQHVQTVTWTADDVKKAGIGNNPNYAKYPRQMLLARASAELERAMCPDVLGGITVFAEEAVDIDDGPVTDVAEKAVEKPKGTTRKRQQATVAPPAEPDEAEPGQEPTDYDKPSAAQTKMAMAEFTEIGITDRPDRLAATAAFVGHPVTSWTDLNRDEASTVIDGLERIKAGTASFTTNDDATWTVTATEEGDEPSLPGDDWNGQ